MKVNVISLPYIFQVLYVSCFTRPRCQVSVYRTIGPLVYFIVQFILYNYADDNTLSFIHKDLKILKTVLEQESNNLISWFVQNFMKANPDKFQAICVEKKALDNIQSFQIAQTSIKCEENVTLLGINIYFMLKFDDYIPDICIKASKQLAVVKRLGSFF